jgi:hypothetical protein
MKLILVVIILWCVQQTEKFNRFIQESHVYAFFVDHDDKLDSEQSNILHMTPFSIIEQAFARVKKEALREEIMNKGEDGTNQISTMMISKAQRKFEVNHNSNRSILC